jgi:hypothetical protein
MGKPEVAVVIRRFDVVPGEIEMRLKKLRASFFKYVLAPYLFLCLIDFIYLLLGMQCIDAVHKEDFAKVNLFLESGIPITYWSAQNRTPLNEACKNGSVTMVSLLLNYGGDADQCQVMAKKGDNAKVYTYLMDKVLYSAGVARPTRSSTP